MFTWQAGNIADATSFEELAEVLGNCAQPLEHRAPVTVSATLPADATQAALTLNAYQAGGGEGAYGIALKINGSISQNGMSLMGIPVGGILPWSGTAAALTALTATGYWAQCDGSNGTPDLRDRFIVCKGSTYTSTGGAATHDHGAATGSGGTGNTGNSSTGLTVNDHTGFTSGASSGNTGTTAATIVITDPQHSHAPTTAAINYQAGATPQGMVTAIFNAATGITATDNGGSGHSHTLGAHTHDLGTITHTVNDSGHVHTGPSHTHSISSASNIPPYFALTFIMRIL